MRRSLLAALIACSCYDGPTASAVCRELEAAGIAERCANGGYSRGLEPVQLYTFRPVGAPLVSGEVMLFRDRREFPEVGYLLAAKRAPLVVRFGRAPAPDDEEKIRAILSRL